MLSLIFEWIKWFFGLFVIKCNTYMNRKNKIILLYRINMLNVNEMKLCKIVYIKKESDDC